MGLQASDISLSSSNWQNLNFFKDTPYHLLKDLLCGAEVVTSRQNKIIFYEGESADNFGFVLSGMYKLFKKNQFNQRSIMDFVLEGDMIAGLLMASDNSTYPVTVKSISESRFLKIPKTTYNQFWCSNSEVMRKMQIANADRVRSHQIMREAQRLPLEQRVAWTLVKLFSRAADQNKILCVNFSRSDIADTMGAALESVIRVFSQWTQAGYITNKDDCELIDLKQISRIVLKMDYSD